MPVDFKWRLEKINTLYKEIDENIDYLDLMLESGEINDEVRKKFLKERKNLVEEKKYFKKEYDTLWDLAPPDTDHNLGY